jgi:hypothetical protein
MAPHMTPKELDLIRTMKGKGKTPLQIHESLQKRRTNRGQVGPDISNVRKAVKGETFRSGMVETRGRKRILSARAPQKLNTVRKLLIKKAKGEREVTWGQAIKRPARPARPGRGRERVREYIAQL